MQSNSQQLHCANCGTVREKSNRFCVSCGTSTQSAPDIKCPACGADNSADAQACERCGGALQTTRASTRYHGLDALRGVAMLLGIVLHAALPYIPGIEAFWPADESSSYLLTTIFQFIHMWRMPVFFILAGFFANLVISRKSWSSWWGNRLLRIGLPIMVFFPLMGLTLPWIFKFGETGEFTFFYSNVGQPFHLWFLWHLMIFVIITALFRLPYLLSVKVLDGLNKIGLDFAGKVFRALGAFLSGILLRSRFPVVLIVACAVINVHAGGELIINPFATGLYFVVGYSLYSNSSLFTFLTAHWKYYLAAGIVVFALHTILTAVNAAVVTDIYGDNSTRVSEKESDLSDLLGLFIYLTKISGAVLFSYAFIGLSENKFGAYNAKLRFISDGAYWIYLIHLPIVTLITFSMLNLPVFAEAKFLIAVIITFITSVVSYKYFVRHSFIGILLNGRRYPMNERTS